MEPLSILVASRNTLPFLQLCLKSLRGNLARKDHEILVLDDASTDGSVEWLESNRSRYDYRLILHRGEQRMGIVGAYNALVEAAKTPAVWLAHTDMYFARNADEETARFLGRATACTCTRIEPPLYPGAPHKIIADLGMEPATFQEDEFLRLAKDKAQPGRFTEGIFAPLMCLRADFLAVGGLDPAFAPQSKEDSDLFNRMAIAGYRFRQSWSAFCYHFSGRGSRKKDGIGQNSAEWQASNRKNERNFVRRWGSTVRHDEFLKPIVSPPEPVSLVALLGSEADNVLPFLDHLEPSVDEVIFVTDGPQPESVARIDEYVSREEAAGPTLLRRDKIKVFERPLAGNFAAQRNFAQAQCRFDWVLHADLDERFDPAILENLRDIIGSMRRGDKTVCGFPRLNTIDGVLVNDLPRDRWNPEGLGEARSASEMASVRNPDVQFRLLRRDIRWTGKVHEIPESVARHRQSVIVWSHACIRHPKTLDRQRTQDARYEAIQSGASMRPTRSFGDGRVSSSRILMLATEYPPAEGYGLARYAAELAASLAGSGHEVHVITANEKRADSVNGLGPRVHDAGEAAPLHHYEWVGDTVLANIFMTERALKVCEACGPFDVLISHDWLSSHTAKSLKGILGLPWLLMMHDTEAGKRDSQLTGPQAYVAQMEEWATAHADLVLTTSEHMREELVRVCRVTREKIRVVRCGVRAERFQTGACLSDFRAIFCSANQPLIAYVGRLSPMKGLDDLAEAFILLSRTAPECRLVVAGEGVLRNSLEQRLTAAGLGEHVIFAGWLSDRSLGCLYRVADTLVVPSRYEPFGLVALEAAACGGVVIAAETGGLEEIVRKSKGAIQGVPPRNPAALARAIERTLSQRSNDASLRLRAREYAVSYSWKRVAVEISELSNKIIGKAAGASGRTHERVQ